MIDKVASFEIIVLADILNFKVMPDKTIYILHGWSTEIHNEKKWDLFRKNLIDKGIKTVFFALPVLDIPATAAWSLDDYAHWLARQLPQKKQVKILGHSFGGQIAVRFNTLYPNRIEQLFLVASAGIPDNSFKIRLKRGIFLLLAKLGKQVTRSQVAKKLLYQFAHEQDYFRASEVQRQTMGQIIRSDIETELSNITAPTVLIWGEQDRITPFANTAIFLGRIRGSVLEPIIGARHSPVFTHPEITAEKVVQHFL